MTRRGTGERSVEGKMCREEVRVSEALKEKCDGKRCGLVKC